MFDVTQNHLTNSLLNFTRIQTTDNTV